MTVPNVLNELTEKERNVYITSLLYILDLNDSSARNMDYVLSRINDLGLDESVLKKIKRAKGEEEMYKLLAEVKNIRTRRYILREMILVAISNHELSDGEVASIYNIGRHVGIISSSGLPKDWNGKLKEFSLSKAIYNRLRRIP